MKALHEVPRKLLQRLGQALLIIGVWLVLGVFLGVQSHFNSVSGGHPVPLWSAVGFAVERYLVYALLTFPVLWVCRRFPFTTRRWPTALLAHALGLAGFVVLYPLLRSVTGSVRDAETLRPLPPSLDSTLRLMSASVFDQCWMYASITAVILALEYYRQYRTREVREAELRRQMAEYRLQVLRLQLHPHFLFNAMNGIATLMQRDVLTAREMLLRLSELLRIALTHSADNETSLREEIEFVRAYLDLERMRFGDRLTVSLAIDPGSLDARVPYMILQPLVENAVRHGIAEIRSGGTLALATSCRDGRLCIHIVNDGPRGVSVGEPLPADTPAAGMPGPRGAGIGLQNARARLRLLYGDSFRMSFASRPQGGAELRLDLPFRGAGSEAREEGEARQLGDAGEACAAGDTDSVSPAEAGA